MKKLQTPLYEEFYNSLNAAGSASATGIEIENKENFTINLNLPAKSRSPNRVRSRRLSAAVDVAYTARSGTRSQISNIGTESDQTLLEVQPSKPSSPKLISPRSAH